jgi:hypothetical protein
VNDETAIANLVHRYAELIDAGDYGGVGQLFEHGAIRAVQGDAVTTVGGRAEVQAFYERYTRRFPDSGTPKTKHLTTNLIIEVDGDRSTATCRSYFTVLQACDGFPLQPIIAGRYHDTLERVGGAWRFADRLIHSDLVGELSHHLVENPLT